MATFTSFDGTAGAFDAWDELAENVQRFIAGTDGDTKVEVAANFIAWDWLAAHIDDFDAETQKGLVEYICSSGYGLDALLVSEDPYLRSAASEILSCVGLSFAGWLSYFPENTALRGIPYEHVGRCFIKDDIEKGESELFFLASWIERYDLEAFLIPVDTGALVDLAISEYSEARRAPGTSIEIDADLETSVISLCSDRAAFLEACSRVLDPNSGFLPVEEWLAAHGPSQGCQANPIRP